MNVVEVCDARTRQALAAAERYFDGNPADGGRYLSDRHSTEDRVGPIAREQQHRPAPDWIWKLSPPDFVLFQSVPFFRPEWVGSHVSESRSTSVTSWGVLA